MDRNRKNKAINEGQASNLLLKNTSSIIFLETRLEIVI